MQASSFSKHDIEMPEKSFFLVVLIFPIYALKSVKKNIMDFVFLKLLVNTFFENADPAIMKETLSQFVVQAGT